MTSLISFVIVFMFITAHRETKLFFLYMLMGDKYQRPWTHTTPLILVPCLRSPKSPRRFLHGACVFGRRAPWRLSTSDFGPLVTHIFADDSTNGTRAYWCSASRFYSHSLHPWRGLVVPLEGLEPVAVQLGEGVDNMGTQARVDILGEELGWAITVLGPVRVVTYSPERRGWKAINNEREYRVWTVVKQIITVDFINLREKSVKIVIDRKTWDAFRKASVPNVSGRHNDIFLSFPIFIE